DNLTSVRTKNDMLNWIKFFLSGVENTAQDAVNTLSNVLQLKIELDNLINKEFGRRSPKGIFLLQNLFKNPVVTIEDVKNLCKITFKSASALVNAMVENDILIEQTGQ